MKLFEDSVDEFGVPEVGPKENFLPEKLVMLDCEMTGVVPGKHDLLQIAMIKLKLEGNEYKEDGRLEIFLKNDKKPVNDFQKEFLTHVFDACNKSDVTPDQAKEKIHEFLGKEKGKITPVGDCVHCDIEFLYQSGCADRPDIADDGEKILGTFHYEAFDLNPLKAVSRQKEGKKFKYEELPPHDAMNDCVNQLTELNHYLGVLE